LDERLHARRGRQTRPEVVAEIERLTGRRPTLDDFLSVEATDALLRRYVQASGARGVQRQTWSTDLGTEMTASVRRLSDTLDGVEE
jgi:hypothetical protein